MFWLKSLDVSLDENRVLKKSNDLIFAILTKEESHT